MGYRYRLKKDHDVIVEAFQYDGDFKNSNGEPYVPLWAVHADPAFLRFDSSKAPGALYCGDKIEVEVHVGDFVIKRESDDRIYKVSDSLFRRLHEAVE